MPLLYLPDDLNSTHQHCVLAGDAARFSSTHRVAEVRGQPFIYFINASVAGYMSSKCHIKMQISADTGDRMINWCIPKLCNENPRVLDFGGSSIYLKRIELCV